MIYKNTEMARLLKIINFDEVSKKELHNISGVVSPIFVEVEDCVLIKDENEDIKELNMNLITKAYGDKTGFEASNNHIHISQYVDDGYRSPIKELKLAMYILDAWKIKLKTDFPEYKFHLILSYDGKESTLRFHKYREDEGFWLIIDDLDGYEEEAILILEI
jgi:hypothetical protein